MISPCCLSVYPPVPVLMSVSDLSYEAYDIALKSVCAPVHVSPSVYIFLV
jgi:hypothetical protein